jgi:alpha-tubulin suppressor-like RCC1 family protein
VFDNAAPQKVVDINTATGLAAGETHTCAILAAGGSVKCWGKNIAGQLGDGTIIDSKTPVLVNAVTTAIALTAGESHTCALLLDGSVKCWGANNVGQLGNEGIVPSLSPVTVIGVEGAVAISSGADHTCARLSDSSVKCWGDNIFGQSGQDLLKKSFVLVPAIVTGVNTAVKIAMGDFHSCAVLSDGNVSCWGSNSSGQIGSAVSRFEALSVRAIGIP